MVAYSNRTSIAQGWAEKANLWHITQLNKCFGGYLIANPQLLSIVAPLP